MRDTFRAVFGQPHEINQQRSTDGGATRESETQTDRRIYIQRFGTREYGTAAIVIDGDYTCIAIGPGSHHSACIVKPNGSDRFYRCSIDAPLIGTFKGPLLLAPYVQCDSPLEVIFYKKMPGAFFTKRAPLRRTFVNNAIIGDFDDSPLGVCQAFIAGRKRWRIMVQNATGVAQNLYVLFKMFDNYSSQLYSAPSLVWVQPNPGTTFTAGANAGLVIQSDVVSYPEADAIALSADGSTPWTVPSASMRVDIECED